MSGIVWQEPPKRSSGRPRKPSKWLPILEPLMEHPKRWALVDRVVDAKHASYTAWNLRSRRVAVPPGFWEFTSRANPDGSGEVYARYLAPEVDA